MDVMDIARFWSHVRVVSPGKCWYWMAFADDGEVGQFKIDGKAEIASRVAYRLAHGDIPDGMVVRHTCDTPLCCNPKHLLIGTHADNVQDRVSRDRSARGEENGRAKLTADAVRLIRRSPLSDEYFAKRFNVDRSSVTAARKGLTWKHIE